MIFFTYFMLWPLSFIHHTLLCLSICCPNEKYFCCFYYTHNMHAVTCSSSVIVLIDLRFIASMLYWLFNCNSINYPKKVKTLIRHLNKFEMKKNNNNDIPRIERMHIVAYFNKLYMEKRSSMLTWTSQQMNIWICYCCYDVIYDFNSFGLILFTMNKYIVIVVW